MRLALATVTEGDLDGALVALGSACIERRDGLLLVECDAVHGSRTVALFARAGARAEPLTHGTAPESGLVPALVQDLEGHTAHVDRISIRALDTGEAAAWLLRKRWRLLRPTADRVAQARRILRGEDRLYAWRRVIWSTAAELRSSARGSVIPIVFDRDALGRSAERMALAGDGLLARWARA